MEALAKASLKSELPLPVPDNFSFTSLFGSAGPKPPILPGGIASLFGTATPAPSEPDGILFRRVDGEKVRFSEPMHFPWLLTPPSFPAVYVILVPDTVWTPLAFRPIYFGETGDAETRPTRSHEHYDDWCRVAGSAANLYVAYYWMFDSTKDERTSVESGLIKQYNPECNIQYNSFAWWLSRADRNSFVPGAPDSSRAYGSLLDALSRIKLT